MDPEIVRTIPRFVLKRPAEDAMRSIGIDFPEFILFVNLPSGAKKSPLLRPAGLRNSETFPSRSTFRMRLLGWSVKNTSPLAATAGPSVNLQSDVRHSKLAPSATKLSVVSWNPAFNPRSCLDAIAAIMPAAVNFPQCLRSNLAPLLMFFLAIDPDPAADKIENRTDSGQKLDACR